MIPDVAGHAGGHGGAHQVIRRFRDDSDFSDAGQQLNMGHSGESAMSSRDLDELIDRIVAKLERRVVADLERRGRRNLPGVF